VAFGAETAEIALGTGIETAEVRIDNALGRLIQLAEARPGKSEPEPVHSIIGKVVSQIEAACENGGRVQGLPFGFADLDKRTGARVGEADRYPSARTLEPDQERLGECKKAIERGENPRHAAYQGREVSTDFAMRVDSKALGFMYNFVMFFRLAVVSWDRLYRGLAHDPNKGAIAARQGRLRWPRLASTC